MLTRIPNLRRAGVSALLALGLIASAADAAAQSRPNRGGSGGRTQPTEPRRTSRPAPSTPAPATATMPRVRSRALSQGGYAVVVDLDQNRLFFAKGRRVLWSAPVGTGTGLRMEHDDGEWDFATPNGTFHVAYKEREPDWIAPDWYFIENDMRVPSQNSDARRFPRGLGSAAVFIGHGLAIHGTDRPELLGQRVSHGCIRLSNADALRLFHNVQVGTEVVITGSGEGHEPSEVPPRRSSRTGPPPRDPFIVELEGEDTYDLLDRLDDELVAAAAARGTRSTWHQVASVLLFRGAKEDDDAALEGLLERIRVLGSGPLRDEYATFLADAFNQGPLRTLQVMAGMPRTTREDVAAALVESALRLYPGEPDDVAAPWPTRRVPRTAVPRGSQRAWDTLQEAEEALRGGAGEA